MERQRFDALTRLLATSRHRRGAMLALLGLALTAPDALATRGGNGGKRNTRKRKRSEKRQGRADSSSSGRQGNGCGDDAADKICADLACGRHAVPSGARPEFCCPGGYCSCGGVCCERTCSQTGTEQTPEAVFCCTGPRKVICQVQFEDSVVETCCDDNCDACSIPGSSTLAGSYRRPGR